MERLTFRHDAPYSQFHKKAAPCEPINCSDEYSRAELDKVIDRLAFYEDAEEQGLHKCRLYDVPGESAAAIEALKAENVTLRKQLADKSKLVCQQAKEMERRDEVIRLQEAEIDRLTVERDALRNELNGTCWACMHAEEYPKGFGGLSSCKYLREQNILATAGKHKCPHWEWRGTQRGGV